MQGVRIAKREKNNQSQSALKKFPCDFKKVTLTDRTMRMIKVRCLLKKKNVAKTSFFRELRKRENATRHEQSPPPPPPSPDATLHCTKWHEI